MVKNAQTGGRLDCTILSKEARHDPSGHTAYEYEVHDHFIEIENDGKDEFPNQLLARYVPSARE